MLIQTPEQRAINLEKAKAARLSSIAYADKHYKQDWLDESNWKALAQKHNIKLPQNTKKATAHGIQKYAKMLGDNDGYLIGEMFTTVSVSKEIVETNKRLSTSKTGEFIPNKEYNLRAYVGWMLELHNEGMGSV